MVIIREIGLILLYLLHVATRRKLPGWRLIVPDGVKVRIVK
jgi:hypothetical protein